METDNHQPAKYADFAARLDAAMRSRNVSVNSLVGEFNISRTAIDKWLAGVTLPNAERLLSLAAYLRVPVEDLVGNDEAKRRSRVRKVTAREHPAAPQFGEVVKRVQFKRPAREAPDPLRMERVEGNLVYSLMDWAEKVVPHIRPEAHVAEYPRINGPVFRYFPDLLIVEDGPLIGVEVTVGCLDNDAVHRLAGLGYNWREATKGAPLVLVFINTDTDTLPVEILHEIFDPFKAAGLFSEVFLYPGPGPGIFDDVTTELARMLKTPKP